MAPYSDIQRREIFHFLFLEELLRISDPRIYVLKGGVNLRLFFKSPRYSEDMDLDVLAGGVTTLKKNGYKILESKSLRRSLQTYGIADVAVNDPSKAKPTETTQRFRLRLITESGDSLPTKVEFSRRGDETLPHALEQIDPAIARYYNRLAYRCPHYTGEAAAVQKVRALAGREVTQARDVFDMGILQAGGYLNKAFVRSAVSRDVRERAKRNLDTLGRDQLAGQVLEFLDERERAQFEPKGAWDALKRSVAEVLSDEK